MIVTTNSEKETVLLGQTIAKKLMPNSCVALYGELGAGKTLLTRSIVNALGYLGEVTSPTYALMHCYELQNFKIYHFDAYRISDYDSLQSSGLFDFLGENMLIIEWAGNIENYLPANMVKIKIKKHGENIREMEIRGIDI